LCIEPRLKQMILPPESLTGFGLHHEFAAFCKYSTAFLQFYPTRFTLNLAYLLL
jgi:hypothetical protein